MNADNLHLKLKFPFLTGFLEKKADEDGLVKEAKTALVKALLGAKGKGAETKAKNWLRDYVFHRLDDAYPQYTATLIKSWIKDTRPAEGIKKVKNWNSWRDVSRDEAIKEVQDLRRVLRGTTYVKATPQLSVRGKDQKNVMGELVRNNKGEWMNPDTGERLRGGLYDEYMALNNTQRRWYGTEGTKGIPKRMYIDNPWDRRYLMSHFEAPNASYTGTKNLIMDAYGQQMYKDLARGDVGIWQGIPKGVQNIYRGASPNDVRHAIRRHELSHWKQVDLPREQLQRNARYADIAINTALRDSGRRFGSSRWARDLNQRSTAINEAFNNIQASAGNGYGATKFRSLTNYNPEHGVWWNMDRKILPNTLLYNGRSGINQAVIGYNMPMPRRGFLP